MSLFSETGMGLMVNEEFAYGQLFVTIVIYILFLLYLVKVCVSMPPNDRPYHYLHMLNFFRVLLPSCLIVAEMMSMVNFGYTLQPFYQMKDKSIRIRLATFEIKACNGLVVYLLILVFLSIRLIQSILYTLLRLQIETQIDNDRTFAAYEINEMAVPTDDIPLISLDDTIIMDDTNNISTVPATNDSLDTNSLLDEPIIPYHIDNTDIATTTTTTDTSTPDTSTDDTTNDTSSAETKGILIDAPAPTSTATSTTVADVTSAAATTTNTTPALPNDDIENATTFTSSNFLNEKNDHKYLPQETDNNIKDDGLFSWERKYKTPHCLLSNRQLEKRPYNERNSIFSAVPSLVIFGNRRPTRALYHHPNRGQWNKRRASAVTISKKSTVDKPHQDLSSRKLEKLPLNDAPTTEPSSTLSKEPENDDRTTTPTTIDQQISSKNDNSMQFSGEVWDRFERILNAVTAAKSQTKNIVVTNSIKNLINWNNPPLVPERYKRENIATNGRNATWDDHLAIAIGIYHPGEDLIDLETDIPVHVYSNKYNDVQLAEPLDIWDNVLLGCNNESTISTNKPHLIKSDLEAFNETTFTSRAPISPSGTFFDWNDIVASVDKESRSSSQTPNKLQPLPYHQQNQTSSGKNIYTRTTVDHARNTRSNAPSLASFDSTWYNSKNNSTARTLATRANSASGEYLSQWPAPPSRQHHVSKKKSEKVESTSAAATVTTMIQSKENSSSSSSDNNNTEEENGYTTTPPVFKSRTRCKFWPNCADLKRCGVFTHPEAVCPRGTTCKFQRVCSYLHYPEDKKKYKKWLKNPARNQNQL